MNDAGSAKPWTVCENRRTADVVSRKVSDCADGKRLCMIV